MTQLINKDALVAEIEKLKDGAHNGVSFNKSRQSMGLKNELSTWEHLENAFATVLKIINTLEVKEVDLEKYYHDFLQKEWFGNSHVRTVSEMMAFTAKHFFELGLKAQKG